MRSAIFAGSFDPFHNGHLSVAKKASELFDDVYITIAHNPNKKNRVFSAEEMKAAIQETLHQNGLTNCFVLIEDGLIAELAQKKGVKYLVRGIRNNLDYNYEENMAQGNKKVYNDIETIYMRADESALSSSFIRELAYYGTDVSEYVPCAINKLIKAKNEKK